MSGRMKTSWSIVLLAVLLVGLLSAEALAQTRTKIRYALGDVISVDELPLLIAVERAKARGLDVEITSFKSEEIATQAVINGQADVGQGTVKWQAVMDALKQTRCMHYIMEHDKPNDAERFARRSIAAAKKY